MNVNKQMNEKVPRCSHVFSDEFIHFFAWSIAQVMAMTCQHIVYTVQHTEHDKDAKLYHYYYNVITRNLGSINRLVLRRFSPPALYRCSRIYVCECVEQNFQVGPADQGLHTYNCYNSVNVRVFKRLFAFFSINYSIILY
jgi:hypothetical protein